MKMKLTRRLTYKHDYTKPFTATSFICSAPHTTSERVNQSMEQIELSWNTSYTIAQRFIDERFTKLIQGDREALLGCYRPNSSIYWKGHMVPHTDIVQYYTSLRNKFIELISIDTQPIPDASDSSWTNQVMVIATVVVSPDLPEEVMTCPTMATHTFILSPDLTDQSGAPNMYISHHIYR